MPTCTNCKIREAIVEAFIGGTSDAWCQECLEAVTQALQNMWAKPCQSIPPLLSTALLIVAHMRKLGADYTDQEMRDAWLTFEAGKREDGRWSWGRGTIPPGDARAALESRMQDLRARRAPALDESKVFWMNKEKLALVQKEIDAIKVRGSVTANGTTYSPEDGKRLRALIDQKKELKGKLNL